VLWKPLPLAILCLPAPYFRLAMQGAGGGSLLFSGVQELPQGYAHYQYWRVTVENGQLILTPTEALETPSAFSQPFFGALSADSGDRAGGRGAHLVLAVTRSPGAAAPAADGRLGYYPDLPGGLPVPALAPFARAGERQSFYLALGGGLFAALLLWPLFAAVIWPATVDGRSRPSNRWRWIIGLLIGAVLVVCILVYPLFMFGASYAASYQLQPLVSRHLPPSRWPSYLLSGWKLPVTGCGAGEILAGVTLCCSACWPTWPALAWGCCYNKSPRSRSSSINSWMCS